MAKKIYIGSSVARAPIEFKKEIEELNAVCRRKGYEVLTYIGDKKADSREVYNHDINCVLKADIMIAECTYPSTGLGYEIATALKNKIKVVAVAQKNEKVSRLIEGIDDKNFSFHRYSKIEEIENLI